MAMTEVGLKLYDTLRGQLTPLVPKRPGAVGVYTCGPTTYDLSHIGHARAAVAPDVLVRHLRASGLEVKYVRNITDVDDKILNRCKEHGEEPLSLSDRMAVLYRTDMRALGCLEPEVEPKVSEHIPQIIELIEQLVARGAAYAVPTPGGAQDVYYAVRAFPEYGKLSKRKVDDMMVGARVEATEQKRDPLDFALWKGCTGEGWGWDSPWGKGRPGWHIECSAMSTCYLGFGFDIHCGGMDLIFPHHENEIAQSEAAHPGEGSYVGMWMHNGFVNIDKEKMAKSLGNFVTVADVYQRNDPEALRYFLLSVHYRGPIAFDTDKLDDGRVVFPGVDEAERRVDYLYQTLDRLRGLAGPSSDDEPADDAPADMPKELRATHQAVDKQERRVREALDDDLNTTVAISVIGELAKSANELCDLVQKRKKDAKLVQAAPTVAARLIGGIMASAQRLGMLYTSPAEYVERTRERRLAIRGLTAAEVQEKITARVEARAAKDFARGDALRAELTAWGIELYDSPEGTTWRILV
jgi:cysteinyl-tRNA synthetase